MHGRVLSARCSPLDGPCRYSRHLSPTGETHFPYLNTSITPRLGDGLVWSNVNAEGAPNERSLHEGRPPVDGEKIAINVWVADKPFSVGAGMDRAVRTGS